MRGRLQGVFTIVVTGGPRIGDIFAGLATAVAAIWVPPLLGGLLIVAILAALMRRQRNFLGYDAIAPTP
jgi:hypothetical protein